MSNINFGPSLFSKVTAVRCKKCQHQGPLLEFAPEEKQKLACPVCQEDKQLVFTFDDGKEVDISKNRLSSQTWLIILATSIIYFVGYKLLPLAYFKIMMIILLAVVIYAVVYNDKWGKKQ